MTRPLDQTSAREPLVLLVPGLGNSGAQHWQTLWEARRADCQRVDLGMWDRPHRNTWVNKLNLAIRAADRPVVLAAHSLGCLAVAWWAQLEQPGQGSASSGLESGKVIGALLVAPPDVDFFPLDERLTAFSPTPSAQLPFPSILVGSQNDPYLGYRSARRLAKTWGSQFADAGPAGHINADSDIDAWPFGQFLLDRLLKAGPAARGVTYSAAADTAEVFGLAHGREASPVRALDEPVDATA